MPWRGPEIEGEYPTLGDSVAEWIEAHLVVPDGELKGEPFVLYDEQWRFLQQWYRLDPAAGKYAKRRGQLMRSQKWGKGPLLAAISAAEAFGPVVPDGWDAAGEPVGRSWPTPWVQLTAVSIDQVDNTYAALLPMLRGGPLVNWASVDIGDTRVKYRGEIAIQKVTSSAGSRLGQRTTFICQDETHLWTESNGGVNLARTQRRNAGGVGGRVLETTNGFAPGGDSVAERTYNAVKKDPTIYVDVRHPRERIDFRHTRKLREELAYVYGDSATDNGGHVDMDRILAECLDPDTGEADARRFFLTELVRGELQYVDPNAWADAEWTKARNEPLPERSWWVGRPVTLGFDGSVRYDTTGLVATDMVTGLQTTLANWTRPEGASAEWEIDVADVDATLRAAFTSYDVQMLYGDPWAGWRDILGRWSLDFPGRVYEFDTTKPKPMAEAGDAWRTAISTGNALHDGGELLTTHAMNVVTIRRGVYDLMGRAVDKSRFSQIDLAMCAALSWAARTKLLADGWKPRIRRKVVIR